MARVELQTLPEGHRDPSLRLRSLHEKAVKSPSSSLADFDWDLRPQLPALIPRGVYLRAISQFYHGELAAGRLCRALAGRLATADANLFLEVQWADEVRHAEIYRRYLEALGGIAPPSEGFTRAFERALAWRGAPEAIVLACHVLLEGEALRVDRLLAGRSSCPLLREISARLARDEARHVAFGQIYLGASLGQLGRGERLAIYRWLKALWAEAATCAFDSFLSVTLPRALQRGFFDSHWSVQTEALQATGLWDDQEARVFLAA